MTIIILASITAVALVASLMASRRKTVEGLRRALRMFLSSLPAFLVMISFAAVALYFLTNEFITANLADRNLFAGSLAAMAVGSIAVLPGFVVFPLGGVLHETGVPLMVIAAFTSALMMVGVVTLPVERKYFGTGFALARNAISLGMAAVVCLVTGLVFGEIL